MFNLETLRAGANLKKSKSLLRIAANGQEKMYNYLSGNDISSTYGAENVKYILEMQGDLDWTRISDITNALFSIGYSEQGNIIGILTNTNAMLQDMLIYCSLEEAKENLKKALTIEVGSKKIIGKRYAVDGGSPLTFALPLVTKSGYRTYAPVIHKHHSQRFIEIMTTIDIDALTEEDMKLIANDFSFLSRTQELAIDVAKDKTIEIVDTSEWLEKGIKPKNYYLAKQNASATGWYAQDNLSEIIRQKKKNEILSDFNIIEVVPEEVKSKVRMEVKTSESLSREVLTQAVKDYFNNEYKDMLLYSQETALSQKAKAAALEHPEISEAFKQVISAYRSYMIDNIPKNQPKDMDTSLFINKMTKEKLAKFASICRNTIYKIGEMSSLNAYTIALIAYGTDLVQVSTNEGKFFRAIMPEEFKKLYAAGKKAVNREKLFFVDDFIKDCIDDGEEYIVDFKDGQAYDELGNLIAKGSFKYNSKNAKLVLEEETGRYYAETELGVSLPEVGEEVLILINNFSEDTINEINSSNNIDIIYTPKSPNNSNVLFKEDCGDKIVEGTIGYRGILTDHYRYMLINNANIKRMATNKQYDLISVIINDFERVDNYKLMNTLNFKEVICINKDTEYETHYGIVIIK